MMTEMNKRKLRCLVLLLVQSSIRVSLIGLLLFQACVSNSSKSMKRISSFWIDKNQSLIGKTNGLYFHSDRYCYPFTIEKNTILSHRYNSADFYCDEIDCNKQSYHFQNDSILVVDSVFLYKFKFLEDNILVLYPISHKYYDSTYNDTFYRDDVISKRIEKEFFGKGITKR